jgi:formate dehydrogenase subunit gamma
MECDPQLRGQLLQITGRYKDVPGPLLEVLHAVQRQLGFVPPAALPVLAAELNLSRAEVQGAVSFYHYFRHSPPGEHTLRVCRAEACQSMGGRELAAHAQRRLGIGFHETTTDGRWSLEPVFCLGNCACAPAVMTDEMVHGRVSAARLDELLAGKD